MTNIEAFLNWVFNLSPSNLNRDRADVIADYVAQNPGGLTAEEITFLTNCTLGDLRKRLHDNMVHYHPSKEFKAGSATGTTSATSITSPYIIWVYP